MKKVLIITYYWPPAGGVSVNRCLKFAKYLRNYGWEPIIYTTKDAQYPFFDYTNLKQIPEGLTVIKHPIIEPFNIFNKLSGRGKKNKDSNPVFARDKKRWIDNLAIWIRGNFFIPDARSMWIKPSVKFLLKYVNENHIDAILTDGPPHTNTAIGYKLSEKTNIPWLSDFQDPWTQVDYYQMFKITKWADKIHRRMEQKAFRIAKKITIASPTWAKDLESIGAKNVSPIFWGYDEDDFKGIEVAKDKKFTIIHAGTFSFDRNPEVLLKVLGDLKTENPQFGDNLKIRLAGIVDYSIVEGIKKNNLLDNFEALGSIERPKVIEMTNNAWVLLLPLNKADNIMGRIPGKLFENMRARVPILCLGPQNSDVDKILKETNTGQSIDYDNYSELRSFILKQYDNYLNKNTKTDSSDISKYSVENQVKKISEYLNEIIHD